MHEPNRLPAQACNMLHCCPMSAVSEKTENPGGRKAKLKPVLLVVDDEFLNLESLGQYLAMHGYEVAKASSGEQAMQMVPEVSPDLIMLDLCMPKVNGLEVLRRLRRKPESRNIPIIIVSALSDTDTVVTGLHEGANDYITKPIDLPVLLARIETHLKLAELVNRLQHRSAVYSQLAAEDDLTGICNRRSLFEVLNIEIKRSLRYGSPLSLAMIDLDFFKPVNDKYGHDAGDKILRQVASRISGSLRGTDLLCRYGGEEFCVILPHTTGPNAVNAAEHIRTSVEKPPFELGNDEIGITLSIGVATLPDGAKCTAGQLIKNADKALYEAKRSGRNRVCVYEAAQEHRKHS